ncbi:hypothetical protein K1719_014224 [Acacia pycnantha]|nr:hypothetical protein K1719_014224 [Acacia pycnantha]
MLNRSGGRDRFRRDYPSRFEDKGNNGRSNSSNPPSRHLWVGNLAHSITENELARYFLQFGPLESVAFQPARSYAFINFRRDEDAIDALKELQGYPVAGNPLRVEFAKADKPPSLTHDEDYSWDERSSGRRGSPFTQREFRGRHGSPEPPYHDKSKLTDKNPEPSEVLWIGFPSQLNVNDLALRRAFSSFGEIEKITTFPGRSYAFVRFRSLSSARRAIDALQGKLFGNPRVHICFAKSETGSSGGGRFSTNTPSSPFYTSSRRHGSIENLRQDRGIAGFSGDRSASSPNIFPKWDLADSDPYDSDGRGSSRARGFSSYEQRRVGERVPPLGVLQDSFEHSISPSRDRQAHLGTFPQRYPQKHALFEDPRDFPDDVYYQHDTKKLKTGSLPPEKELPEYPLSDLEGQRRPLPRLLTDLPQHEVLDKRIDAGPVVPRQTFDPRPNSPFGRSDRSERWKPSDSFHVAPSALQSYSIEKRRLTPEPSGSSLTEWKWEGTIAKGGTPVCRARCFPVGKVMDIMLRILFEAVALPIWLLTCFYKVGGS